MHSLGSERPLPADDLRKPRSRRNRSVRTALAIGLGLTLVTLFFSVALGEAQSDGPGALTHGRVVVQFDDSRLAARAITFTAPVSGLRALELSGLEMITVSTSFGPAVCSIEGVGCPAEDCFCGGNVFWGYKSWDGNAWQDYTVGPGDSTVNDGAIEGWRWGEWGSAMWPATPVTAALEALDWLRPL